MEKLIQLYASWSGKSPAHVEKMAGAGSNREYYRMADAHGHTVIGVVGTSIDENRAFISIDRQFVEKQLPVPRLLAVSDDEMRYLQTDLGNTSLFDAIKGGRDAGGRYNVAEKELLFRTIRELPNIQIRGAYQMDWSKCYPQPEFDEDSVLFDLNYFKYCFLKPTDIDFHEMKLEATFRRMAKDLTSEPGECFLYRDFQSRNVMMRQNGDLVFIDYQGGRRGPLLYDPASFIYQAKAGLSSAMRHRLFEHYMDALSAILPIDKAENRTQLKLFVLFRTLQVLGAYGYRGFFEKKPHFIQSVPFALANLKQLLLEGTLHGTYLAEVLTSLVGCEIGNEHLEPFEGLTVDVWSFSYRKGMPEDYSGNGGGFVFDCRSVHNPGRLPHLASLTGRDTEVIHYLDESKEMEKFLLNAKEIVDASVSRYVSRGFKNLMVSFGCTGGQHRSVYSAEHMTFHLKQKFPTIRVILRHREIGVTEK